MFVVGFSKIATWDHNNQGLEFKNEDTNPSANVGPGGMAPSAIAGYQPVDEEKGGKNAKRMTKQQATEFAFRGKLGEDIMGGGSSGQGASTLASQLKDSFHQTNDWSHEFIGDDRERKFRRKQVEKVLGRKK